jgi:hypothetical protein
MASSRVRRGRETEQAVADYLAASGFSGAGRVPAGMPGSDVTGIPFSCEVKARRGLDIPAWLRQAERRDGLAVLVHRPDGMGVESVASWPMTMRLSTGADLLRIFFDCVGIE